jgi:hypothetical protein
VAQVLPFQFFYYGNPVSNFKVSLNGQISFSNPTGLPGNANTNLPSAAVPDKSILCFWDEFIPIGSGVYWVRVTNTSTNCVGRDTISVQLNSIPQFNLGNHNFLCSGTLTLQVSNSNNYVSLWNTGAVSNSIVVPNSGTYGLRLTDTSTGCSFYDSIQVVYDTVQIFAGNDTAFCGNGTLIPLVSPSYWGYSWNGGTANIPLLVSQSGRYGVSTRIAFTGCSATDSVDITSIHCRTFRWEMIPFLVVYQLLSALPCL